MTPDAIITAACCSYGTNRAELLGPLRTNGLSRARRQVWHDLRRLGYSLDAIGYLTNRHHSTVLHGLRRVGAA